MTEPTYTIKPLVWKHTVVHPSGNSLYIAKTLFGTVRIYQIGQSEFAWHFGDPEELLDCGKEFRSTDAKLAAESAYRRLLAEHLVEVK